MFLFFQITTMSCTDIPRYVKPHLKRNKFVSAAAGSHNCEITETAKIKERERKTFPMVDRSNVHNLLRDAARTLCLNETGCFFESCVRNKRQQMENIIKCVVNARPKESSRAIACFVKGDRQAEWNFSQLKDSTTGGLPCQMLFWSGWQTATRLRCKETDLRD